MAVATLTSPTIGPLTASHQNEVAAAYERARKIRKAAAVAAFNGWMTAIFAVFSAPFAPFSVAGFLVTVGLAVVAYNEFRGRKRLLKFDRKAPVFLGWNQVGFMAFIIVYCVWMLIIGLMSEGPFAAELKAKPELSVALDSVDELDQLYRILSTTVYGTVIILSGIFQGLNALYYFTRRKHVEVYVHNTPAWVLDLQRLTTPQ